MHVNAETGHSAVNPLPYYQNIAVLSGQMLSRARAHEWDALNEIYERYTKAIHALESVPPLTDTQKQERRRLLQQILDHDARLRAFIYPEYERLGYLLGQGRRQQKVLDHYYKSSLQ